MRKLLTILVLSSLLVTSCKKDENQVMLEGGTAPVLTASSTAPLALDPANRENTALTLSWTNPDYQFTTGTSSQNVTYTIQVARAGTNFTGAIQEMPIPNDNSVALKVKDVNGFLSKMELVPNIPYDMIMRIKSTLGTSGTAGALYSNVIAIKITPYLDFAVEPPGTAPGYDNGNLWVVGDCFPGPNWTNPVPAPYDVSLKFTKIDKLHYELIADFDATGGYKYIQEQGVWSSQYHAMTAGAALSGDFEKKDADPQFASPGTGRYKIEVNFQTGKYKLTPQ